MLDATTDTVSASRGSRLPTGAPLLVDLLIATAATGAALWVMVASTEVGARPPDGLGVGLLAAAGSLLLARRRWPAWVLVAVVAMTLAYLALDYPGGAEVPLVMAGLYTAVAEGRRLVGLSMCGFIVVWGVTYRLLVDGDDPPVVAGTALVLVLVVALGEATRARRQLREEVRERLRLLQHEKELEAQANLTEERLRIARELHDVLAHTITAISVQAGAAADGLDEQDPARPILRSMRVTARDAMHQLQATIAVLRSRTDGTTRLAMPGLADVEQLADSARAAGLHVEVDVPTSGNALPAAVELTAYRIVQEALTNVVRHAEARRVQVTVSRDRGSVTVRVADDGEGASPDTMAASNGFGLAGMRERVEAIGGSLDVGPREGGFEVHAVLPIAATHPTRDELA